jgi:hypothetical protein
MQALAPHPLDELRLPGVTKKFPDIQFSHPHLGDEQEVVKVKALLIQLPKDVEMVPGSWGIFGQQHDGWSAYTPFDRGIDF